MMTSDLFQLALNITSPWFIRTVDFCSDKKRLDIHIDFKRGSTFTDDDEPEKPYKAYDTVEKTWRHLNFFEHECYLHARVPRIKKTDGKVKLVTVPWGGVMSGFTLLFEALLFQLCKTMPVHNVAQLTKVSDHRLWRMLDIYIEKAKISEDFSDIKVVGMDETSVAKGHDYITLFVDLKEKKIKF